MKKSIIAILLVLVVGMVGVWAADGEDSGDSSGSNNQTSASIKINTQVADFMHIGLTDYATGTLVDNAFSSADNFLSAVGTALTYDEEDFESLSVFENPTTIAYIWGITNTIAADLTVTISTEGFKGIDDTSSVIPLKLNGDEDSTTMIITKAQGNALGILNTSNSLSVQEKTAGSIAAAPAQTYEATITIEITT